MKRKNSSHQIGKMPLISMKGLLVDLEYGDIVGLYAFLYMICGFFSGKLKRLFYSENVLMPLLLVFANDFVYNLSVYIFRFLLRNKQDFPYYFLE